jgi:hypothetical protein
MKIHEDTLQGLHEALAYVKGDKTKARERLIEIPENDVIQKYNQLPDDVKQSINVIIENAFKITRPNL